ncbi:MAG TPA: hypothetical protein PLG34_07835 [Spirochaetota bacterium]|jgi:hypothetical protein|nr:MAG: hypothetical protein BWX91_01937 [Spirochaetes bacterium ADurb.Bin133]HNZ26137.1 hypothetical protein [Spirochaetota bacterium]HPY87878.1 hypothetical protein [Spirochaetota bacterium]HQB60214.1 hypothetical protein [Spirochaetota bacterium]
MSALKKINKQIILLALIMLITIISCDLIRLSEEQYYQKLKDLGISLATTTTLDTASGFVTTTTISDVQRIYMVGNFNNWTLADDAAELTMSVDPTYGTIYEITVADKYMSLFKFVGCAWGDDTVIKSCEIINEATTPIEAKDPDKNPDLVKIPASSKIGAGTFKDWAYGMIGNWGTDFKMSVIGGTYKFTIGDLTINRITGAFTSTSGVKCTNASDSDPLKEHDMVAIKATEIVAGVAPNPPTLNNYAADKKISVSGSFNGWYKVNMTRNETESFAYATVNLAGSHNFVFNSVYLVGVVGGTDVTADARWNGEVKAVGEVGVGTSPGGESCSVTGASAGAHTFLITWESAIEAGASATAPKYKVVAGTVTNW